MERRTVEDALEIGREALRISRALPHGDIGRWLKATFGERRARTIYNWIGMAAYAEAHPEEFESFSILDLSAVYLLTAPKTPRTAVEAIVRELDAGSVPSARIVRAAISLAKKRERDSQISPALAAKKRTIGPAAHIYQRDEQEIARREGSAAAPRDERDANGLAALQAVARLIPRDDRERAIGWLREAAEARCGLYDLIRSLSSPSGEVGMEHAEVEESA
jgi:hypothetical protein